MKKFRDGGSAASRADSSEMRNRLAVDRLELGDSHDETGLVEAEGIEHGAAAAERLGGGVADGENDDDGRHARRRRGKPGAGDVLRLLIQTADVDLLPAGIDVAHDAVALDGCEMRRIQWVEQAALTRGDGLCE